MSGWIIRGLGLLICVFGVIFRNKIEPIQKWFQKYSLFNSTSWLLIGLFIRAILFGVVYMYIYSIAGDLLFWIIGILDIFALVFMYSEAWKIVQLILGLEIIIYIVLAPWLVDAAPALIFLFLLYISYFRLMFFPQSDKAGD